MYDKWNVLWDGGRELRGGNGCSILIGGEGGREGASFYHGGGGREAKTDLDGWEWDCIISMVLNVV